MSVTKCSGGYFWREARVWLEALQTGVPPAWWGSLNGAYPLPPSPIREIIKTLAEGHGVIPHVQSNRVGVYQICQAWGKSVSLWAYGMTPPERWRETTAVFDAILRKEVEKYLSAQEVNAWAQGRVKVPSQGVAANFHHWLSSAGVLHAHSHTAIINVSATADGKLGSIANAHRLFDEQGEFRARCNKALDDYFQAQGYATKRVGSAVELANVPEKLLRELSPSRAAMDEARAKTGFDSAKANDFYARQARRELGETRDVSPADAYAASQAAMGAHGFKPEHLKRTDAPEGPRSAVAEQHVAYEAAREALDSAGKRYGIFTPTEFRERLFTLGIGRAVSYASLEAMGDAVVREPERFGLKAFRMDGKTLFATKESLAEVREVEREFVRVVERPNVQEAWDDLKKAAAVLKDAVTVATIRKGTEVLTRLKEWFDPEPKVQTISGKDLGAFVEKHHRTHYVVAHAVALLKGLVAPGNPHDKAGHAEKVYAALRAYERVPRGTVLVVEEAYAAAPRELRALARIQKRDKVSVILCERPDPGEEPQRGQSARKEKAQEQARERQKGKDFQCGL